MKIILTILLMLTLGACATTDPAPRRDPPQKPVEKPQPPKPREDPVPEKPAEPEKPLAKPEAAGLPDYRKGVRRYEEGQYALSGRHLNKALAAGLAKPEQVQAHKYLAFIACVTGDEASCRAEFRKALALNPNFALSKAEAGHPTWGPVFKEVKAAQKKR